MVINCIDEIIDLAMEGLPLSLDLADAGNRLKIREWMRRICVQALNNAQETIADASAKAVSDSMQLVIDPQYYEKKKKRRKVREAKKAAEKSNPVLVKAQYAFDRLPIKGRAQ